jgi:transposase-like protein
MSEVKKRKVHGADFKAKVGLEAIRGLKTLNEIGQDYGVHPVQVLSITHISSRLSGHGDQKPIASPRRGRAHAASRSKGL